MSNNPRPACICGHDDWQHEGNYGSLGCTLCDCLGYDIDLPKRLEELKKEFALYEIKRMEVLQATIKCHFCDFTVNFNDHTGALKQHLSDQHRHLFLDTLETLCEKESGSYMAYRLVADKCMYLAREIDAIEKKLEKMKRLRAMANE